MYPVARTLRWVKTRPEELEEGDLLQALAESWGLEVEVAEYAEVGFGSHHWFVTDTGGTRRFVTVDDLDHTPWLGDTREAAFASLRRAFDTAVALREDGLSFVVAPIPTSRGETVRRIGSRYTVSLFPVVDGHGGQFGRYDSADERAAVVAMLARLHAATAAAGGVVRTAEICVQGRRQLEEALREVHTAWAGGPLSDPARRILAAHASDVAALLAAGVRLGAEVAARSTNCVVTHGEPHPGNVMRSGENLLLVDWDTVALAPPERDLWLVVGDGRAEVDSYTAATGHSVDANAIAFFGLAWELADLAAFIDLLRSSPRPTEETEVAYGALTHCATIRERWGSLLG